MAAAEGGMAEGADGGALSRRPRVVILGSGWSSVSLIKALPENIRYVCNVYTGRVSGLTTRLTTGRTLLSRSGHSEP